MAEQTNKTNREPLMHVLMDANKRASEALAGARAISAQLFGPRPEDSTASMPEMSVAGMAGRLVGTLAELEEELTRQHNAIGEATPAAQQGRAVGY